MQGSSILMEDEATEEEEVDAMAAAMTETEGGSEVKGRGLVLAGAGPGRTAEEVEGMEMDARPPLLLLLLLLDVTPMPTPMPGRSGVSEFVSQIACFQPTNPLPDPVTESASLRPANPLPDSVPVSASHYHASSLPDLIFRPTNLWLGTSGGLPPGSIPVCPSQPPRLLVAGQTASNLVVSVPVPEMVLVPESVPIPKFVHVSEPEFVSELGSGLRSGPESGPELANAIPVPESKSARLSDEGRHLACLQRVPASKGFLLPAPRRNSAFHANVHAQPLEGFRLCFQPPSRPLKGFHLVSAWSWATANPCLPSCN